MENFILSITGKDQTSEKSAALSTDQLKLEQSIVLSTAARSGSQNHLVKVDDKSLIEVELGAEGEDQNTKWLCSSDSFLELFPKGFQLRSANGVIEVPFEIEDPSAERNIGSVLIKVINIFTKNKISQTVGSAATKFEDKGLLAGPGLFRLDENFNLIPFTSTRKSTSPYLLFIHGTASSTSGSFGEIRNSPLWTYIVKTYGDNVLAFEHRTLSENPLENALQLIQELPANGALHIISHSRGGIIGDILSKCFNGSQPTGFSPEEIKLLKKEDRKREVELINKISNAVGGKKITIQKFVRVACPASGTILASKRLDHVLNVILNLIGLTTAGNVLYAAFKELLITVIESKGDPEILPGIEAMDPSSPFIKVMNTRVETSRVSDPLVVIAGNCKLKVNAKGLKVLASKLFFLRNNDLVVNSNAMLQGVYRKGSVQYMFDDRAEVDHFSYFSDEKSQNGLLEALKAEEGKPIPGFTYVEQTSREALDRNALLRLEGGHVFEDKPTGTKPIVVLLPGIMGSTLAEGDSLLWIKYRRMISGDLTGLGSPRLNATGLVATSYERLVNFLKPNYDVVTFAFDWRDSLANSAKKFNDRIEKLLLYNQPIKIIGHSMGGVLVRDFILGHEKTWQQLNDSIGFRLIFLGAPLGGSFRIPAVLMGQDPIIEKLAMIDIFHTKKELLETFSKLRGLIDLLPLNPENKKEFDFTNEETWKEMIDAGEPGKNWPWPGKAILLEFAEYRKKVLQGLTKIN